MSDSGNGSTSDEFTVLLEGGRPWGFTLHGGAEFRSPLKIGKVPIIHSTVIDFRDGLSDI